MLNSLKTRWLGVTISFDILLTVVALFLARWLRGWLPAGIYFDSVETYTFAVLDEPLRFSPLFLIPVVVLIWLAVFSSLSIYSEKFTLTQYKQTQPVFVAITGATLVFAGVAYLIFPNLSRLLFLYFYIFDVVLLLGWRKLTFFLLQKNAAKSSLLKQRVLIVGQGDLAQETAAAVQSFAWSGLEFVGYVGDQPDALCAIDDLPAQVERLAINEIIFALPPEHQTLLQETVFKLQPLSVNLRLVPDVADLVFVRATIEDFAGLPLIGLRQPAINPFNRLIKRLFDICVAGALLILSSPVLLIIIILIKLNSKSSTSLFYTSQRVGEGGKLFKMYKFKTMIDGADKDEANLFVQSGDAIGFNKSPNDPRVTKIGRFLRRTSLDEIPQFFNVLKGDMSLVGPRPELPWLVKRYHPWQYQRLTVPQGITGWWQVKNRGAQRSYNVRIEDDLYYIHNYSFLLDLQIVFLTLGAIIRGNGAY